MTIRRIALAALLATGIAAITGCAWMEQKMGIDTPMMTVPLSAAQEVPQNSSNGRGTAKLNLDGSKLRWMIDYSGMSGPVTAGHIHGPAMMGSNAGVVIPFTGSMASPIIGSADVTAAQIADMKAGKYYINLHTAANPGGEIRGQIK